MCPPQLMAIITSFETEPIERTTGQWDRIGDLETAKPTGFHFLRQASIWTQQQVSGA